MRNLTPDEIRRVDTILGAPAEIISSPVTHRADCQPDEDGICDCGFNPPRCSADGTQVHINPMTMQTAYCDGQPMHRWLYCARQIGTVGSYAFGGDWRQTL